MYKDDWKKLEIPEMVGSAGTGGSKPPYALYKSTFKMSVKQASLYSKEVYLKHNHNAENEK